MIYCYHRFIENWRLKKDIHHELLRDQKQFENYERAMNLWNKSYKFSYFEYRARLQEIHLENISDASMNRIDDIEDLFNRLHDDDIVIPSDDDDFFHPEIEKHLLNAPDDKLITWDCYYMNSHVIRIEKPLESNRSILSSSYGVKGKFLKSLDPVIARKILQWHYFVRNHQRRHHLENFEYNCEKTLGFYNHHIGSTTFFRVDDWKLRKTFSSFPRCENWAKPYVKKLHRLYFELGVLSIKI